MVKKMKLPSTCKTKGSWKISLFKRFKTIPPFITKPKNSKNSKSSVSEELLEMAIKALRSNRLFFDPGKTNSILEAARFPFKDCVAMVLETGDPYMEFRISMEEIVEACELKDYEHLEELLAWYLKMNRKINHGFIVGAFIDMFATSNSCSSASHLHFPQQQVLRRN